MRHKQQSDIVYRAKNELIELQREAIKEHLTHKQLIDSIAELMRSVDSKLPYQRKSYLYGFADALRESLYYTHVTYRHEWDGKLYDSWSDLPEKGKEYFRQHTEISQHSHFYWLDSQDIF